MGYETERFLGKVHESLICGICLDVFKDPVELDECQHVFCRDCIGEQLASNAVCPQDRYEINDESLVTPHRYFFDIYNDLKIKCQFYEVFRNMFYLSFFSFFIFFFQFKIRFNFFEKLNYIKLFKFIKFIKLIKFTKNKFDKFN